MQIVCINWRLIDSFFIAEMTFAAATAKEPNLHIEQTDVDFFNGFHQNFDF